MGGGGEGVDRSPREKVPATRGSVVRHREQSPELGAQRIGGGAKRRASGSLPLRPLPRAEVAPSGCDLVPWVSAGSPLPRGRADWRSACKSLNLLQRRRRRREDICQEPRTAIHAPYPTPRPRAGRGCRHLAHQSSEIAERGTRALLEGVGVPELTEGAGPAASPGGQRPPSCLGARLCRWADGKKYSIFPAPQILKSTQARI